jgi:hypothetical protein
MALSIKRHPYQRILILQDGWNGSMNRVFPKLAASATLLLLIAVAAMGVAWLRQAMPDSADPDRPLPVPGKPPPIEMLSIPWKRDSSHPVRIPQPLAVGGLAWMASVDRAGSVNLTATAVPWSTFEPMPVNLTAAAVPWSAALPKNGDDAGDVVIQPAMLPWPIDKK